MTFTDLFAFIAAFENLEVVFRLKPCLACTLVVRNPAGWLRQMSCWLPAAAARASP